MTIRHSKRAVEEELLSRPGVTGVDIGIKEVAGEQTGQLAIRVLVERKGGVPAEQQIPPEIDGFPTDVIERSFELINLPDTQRYYPIVGGASISACRSEAGRPGTFSTSAGTLGGPVIDDNDGAELLLSNFHVLCLADNLQQAGQQMAQPGTADGGTCPTDGVGGLVRWTLTGDVDAAVCSCDRPTRHEIKDLGPIAGKRILNFFDVHDRLRLRKRGRTTGITFGTRDSLDLTTTVDYKGAIGNRTLTNQIGIAVDPTSATFAEQGDSGSLVVTEANQVVGLLFLKYGTGGVANPILGVMQALNVSMCTPDLPDITAIAPPNGSQTGGTPVLISGFGFTGATEVTFGGSPAVIFSVTDTEISALTPIAPMLGPVHVRVRTPAGQSVEGALDLFTYHAPVVVTGLVPDQGPARRRHDSHHRRRWVLNRDERHVRRRRSELHHRLRLADHSDQSVGTAECSSRRRHRGVCHPVPHWAGRPLRLLLARARAPTAARGRTS